MRGKERKCNRQIKEEEGWAVGYEWMGRDVGGKEKEKVKDKGRGDEAWIRGHVARKGT